MSDDSQMDIFGARTIYNIPEANFAKFNKEMAKLSKKAERITGYPVEPMVFGREIVDMHGTKVNCIQVYLAVSDVLKINGWSFVARIDHAHDTGNIVRSLPNIRCEIPESYREAAPACDHCKINRYRKDTFILWNDETNEFKQVGSTCLGDFFGHDPYKVARLAEYLGYANEIGRASEEWEPMRGGYNLWLNVEEFVATSAKAIEKYGWVSRKKAEETGQQATADTTRSMLGKVTLEPQDYEMAQKALEWAQGLRARHDAGEALNEYLHNVMILAEATYMEGRSGGLAASIVATYQRETMPKVESQYVGAVGQKIVGKAKVVKVSGCESAYGYMTIYRFLTENGSVMTWFASASQGWYAGDTITLRGTVKKQEEYRGEKQTILTRCKGEKVSA